MSALIFTTLLLAAAPTPTPAEVQLTSWLVRCDSPDPTLPALDVGAVEAAIAGTAPAPEGWSVKQLPMSLPAGGCWFARRLEPSDQLMGVWFGRMNSALTAYLDGQVIWKRGREAGPFWHSDQGFPALTVPPQLLAADRARLLVVRELNRYGGNEFAAPVWLSPEAFPERYNKETYFAVNLTGAVSAILIAIALAALVTAALRRNRAILYFGIGTLAFGVLYNLVAFVWAPFDHGLITRAYAPAIFAASPFFVLFFQRQYGIHARPIFERIVIGQVALMTLMSVTLPEKIVLVTLLISLPVYMGWLFYAVYLNVRARRQGDPVAQVVIWGFIVMAATVAVDCVRALIDGGAEVQRSGIFQLGTLAFVVSVLVALARQFFRVSRESQENLAKLQRTGTEINALVVSLQSAATQLSSAAAEQVTALAETASTTTEMNQTSAVSATRALELIGKGEAAATVVEDGKTAANTSRDAIEAISMALGSVSGASRELADKVQRIDRIIDTVSFLADQSAALAINASIEASRAGEAGQGFAAVAREVRSLANDSRRATSEVREVLAEIRSRTLEMEEQVDQGGRTIGSGVSQVARMAEVVVSLGGTLNTAVGLMRQVESSARQHQAGVEQVLQAVTHIQRASESIRDGAETLTSLSRTANQLSSGLVQGQAVTPTHPAGPSLSSAERRD